MIQVGWALRAAAFSVSPHTAEPLERGLQTTPVQTTRTVEEPRAARHTAEDTRFGVTIDCSYAVPGKQGLGFLDPL